MPKWQNPDCVAFNGCVCHANATGKVAQNVICAEKASANVLNERRMKAYNRTGYLPRCSAMALSRVPKYLRGQSVYYRESFPARQFQT